MTASSRGGMSGYWASRRVLVTGASGFVGHWLIRELAERGARVTALTFSNARSEDVRSRLQLQGVEALRGDILDLKQMSSLIARTQINTVFHLAANNTNTGSDVAPFSVLETNIRGVYTMLEACRCAPHVVRAIVSSSKEAEDCFTSSSTRKHHPYMTSKAAAELVSRAYQDTYDLPVAVVRTENIYGGGDFNWARLVPGSIRALLHGERPVIRSSGLLQRDYVYIEDVVTAYIAIGERIGSPNLAGHVLRVATGTGSTALDVVQEIARVLGLSDIEPDVADVPHEERMDKLYVPEFESAALDWTARYNLAEGLARTCAWYQDHFRRGGS